MKQFFLALILILLSNLIAGHSLDKLDTLIYDAIQRGKYKVGEKYAREAVDQSQKRFGDQDSTHAYFLSKLAVVCTKLGNYSESELLLNKVLKIQAQTIGVKHYQYASTLNDLAVIYEVIGAYEKAIPRYQNALQIIENLFGKQHTDYALIKNNLALIYYFLGRYKEAEKLYLEVIQLEAKLLGEKSPSFAITLSNLAGLYEVLERFEEAEVLHLKVQKIIRDSLGMDHPNYLYSLNSLAVLYDNMGRLEEAVGLYLETISRKKRVFGGNHPSYVQSKNNLAITYAKMHQYKKAEKLYLEVLKKKEQIYGKKIDYAGTLSDMSVLYQNMGQLKKAELFCLESANILKKYRHKDHPEYVAVINNLASIYIEMGQYKQAMTYSHLALRNITLSNLSLNISKDWLDSLCAIQLPSNRHRKVLHYSLKHIYDALAKSNIPGAKKQRGYVADAAIHVLKENKKQFIAEQDKLRSLEKCHFWVQRGLDVIDLNKDFDKAFQMAELNKSVLLMENMKSAQAHQIGALPDSLINLEKQLFNKLSNLEAELVNSHTPKEKAVIHNKVYALNLNIQAFKKLIAQKFPKYSKFKYQPISVDVKRYQQALSSNEALVEFVVGDSAIFLFYLDQSKTFASKLPITKTALDSHVNVLRQILTNYTWLSKNKSLAFQQFTSSASWLYKKLLGPLNLTENINKLIIIPDGSLAHLPFECLLMDRADMSTVQYKNLPYLIHKVSISYNYSAALWYENRLVKTNNTNGHIFAMAARYESVANSSNTMRQPQYVALRRKLSHLPAAEAEVAALAKKYVGSFRFDSMASEHKFKQGVKNFGIIHLAMHAILDEKYPILSSLALTEDGDPNENNFLQAYEISKLDLNANLAVLSACETGFGKFEHGNGMSSIARSFMYAGVPALVVSLWQVDDLATSKIMKSFYAHLSDGLDKADALRQAKLDYINGSSSRSAHPIFWAPYIQLGNSAPIAIQEKSNARYWLGGLAVLLMLGGLLLYIKRH